MSATATCVGPNIRRSLWWASLSLRTSSTTLPLTIEVFSQLAVSSVEQRALRDIVEAGVKRGDVRPDALVPDCLQVGAALLRTRFEELGPRIPDRVLAGVVDSVLVPMLRPVGTTKR